MTQTEITTEELPTTGRRYYPSTRERITRAMNEGAKSRGVSIPYSNRNSGAGLRRAFIHGWRMAHGIGWSVPRGAPVELSAEFADMIAEVEPTLAGKLDRDSGGRAE